MNWGNLENIQNPKIHVLNLQMNWEELDPNLSFTFQNVMVNVHKISLSHFKHNENFKNL